MSKKQVEAEKPLPPNPIPMDWRGKTAVVISGGPSLTLSQIRHVGIARANDRCRVIAVNDAMYPAWFADIGYAADRQWWQSHQGVQGFPGLKVMAGTVTQRDAGFDDIHPITMTGRLHYDPAPGCLRSGGNSGYQSVHIAANLGAREIWLVAFDYTDDPEERMRVEDDQLRNHWFGKHPGTMDKSSNCQNALNNFRLLSTNLEQHGVKLINASLKTKITWLPRRDISELTQGII